MGYTPERNREYLRQRYADQVADMHQRLGGVCSVCGVSGSLEIDHRDWTQKTLQVNRLWPRARLPEVYEELKKCQLLCREHHLQKTRADATEQSALRPSFKHGTTYGFMKKKCSCGICNTARQDWYDKRNARRRKPGGYGSRR